MTHFGRSNLIQSPNIIIIIIPVMQYLVFGSGGRFVLGLDGWMFGLWFCGKRKCYDNDVEEGEWTRSLVER